MKRICFIGPMFWEKHGQIKNQHEVLASLFTKEGYKCFITSHYKNPFLRALDIVLDVIKNRHSIDVLIIFVASYRAFYFSVLGKLLGSLFGKKTIFHVHGGAFPDYIKQKKALIQKTLTSADAVIVPSQYLRNALEDIGIKSTVINNIINIENYAFRERRPVKPHIFWMRTFHPVYNPLMAIRAFMLVRQEYPEAKLIMAGYDRGLLPEVKQFAYDSGLESTVEFFGVAGQEIKDKIAVDCDIYIHTNHIDNQPVSVLEAAAYGYIIIATEVGGVPYLLEHKQNALLVPDDDHEAMGQFIIEVLKNAELAHTLSMNARKLAEEHAWEKIRHSWENILEAL